MNVRKFQKEVYSYYRGCGRDLPWRPPSSKLPPTLKLWRASRRDKKTLDPYRILVSEIMLQQTRASRVLKKYPEFIRTFPSFRALHRAPLRNVLRVWQGMGYNRRAAALKKISTRVMEEYGGTLPRDPEILETFPGIGRATARSIATFAFNAPTVFVETNIRTVYIHHFFSDSETHAKNFPKGIHDREILSLVEKTLDRKNPRAWYYALMDYGTYLKHVHGNENVRSAHYRKQPSFRGSLREVRGGVLRELTVHTKKTIRELSRALEIPNTRIREALTALVSEEFVRKQGFYFYLAA